MVLVELTGVDQDAAVIGVETVVVREFNGNVAMLSKGVRLSILNFCEVVGRFTRIEANWLVVTCA